MECSTRFPDPVELVRAEIEALGPRLVLRFERRDTAGAWIAELVHGGRPVGRAEGSTPHEAASGALDAARRQAAAG